jgi:hypothetical protein
VSESTMYDVGAPSLELHIFHNGRLIGTELCESEEDAAAAINHWNDRDVTFVVEDLTAPNDPEDALVTEAGAEDDGYQIASARLPEHGAE